eukprot:TRINITY_DN105085_c0_g1_i1.p1 TRINITY_DN105085_c0_g1~~TRINITY_DN105085_c0_g1_i1.p1  ORF type:complete len:173 (+),score=18.13 TRINITY_DN105085_c0_g1_i1:24-521(+)
MWQIYDSCADVRAAVLCLRAAPLQVGDCFLTVYLDPLSPGWFEYSDGHVVHGVVSKGGHHSPSSSLREPVPKAEWPESLTFGEWTVTRVPSRPGAVVLANAQQRGVERVDLFANGSLRLASVDRAANQVIVLRVGRDGKSEHTADRLTPNWDRWCSDPAIEHWVS